jgi:HAD superfamily hydrolase (TIGR01509 family)
MRRAPKAVFWDNDGVLVDTEPLFLQATREHLGPYGVEISEALYVDFSMRQGRSLFELIAARGASEEEIARVRAERDARYMALIEAGVRVIEGVREALEALAGRQPMAIVTASGREHFERIHEPLGLLGHFDFVLASGDYENHKPHPDGYLAAARRLGLDPEDCLAVEDSERGLQAATAAGMPCVVVPGRLSRGGDFRAAQRVLDNVRELPGLL